MRTKKQRKILRSSRKRGGTAQHYPPGTQENFNSFSSRNLIMGKGKELESPEGRGGGKGRRSLCDLNLIARSAMGAASSPGVPPRGTKKETCCMCGKRRKNMLIPMECLIKYGAVRAHKICKKCWWGEFAIEGASHKCPGCVKNTPILPDPHKNTVIDLTAETP
jgi:hypothetical protein